MSPPSILFALTGLVIFGKDIPNYIIFHNSLLDS